MTNTAIRFDSASGDYARLAADRAEAERLRTGLREQAMRVAKQERIPVSQAFERILDAYRTVAETERGAMIFRVIAMLAQDSRRFWNQDETTAFVTFLYDALRDVLKWEPDERRRDDLFLRQFSRAFELVTSHLACPPKTDMSETFVSSSLLTNALTLWAEANCLVPPCRYLRLERALRDRGIVPVAAHAVLRKHGADPLDDMVELVNGGTLDEPGLWAMAVADELPHDPSVAPQPKPPVLTGNRLASALEYAFPGGTSHDRRGTLRGGLFDKTHAYRPGWYKPASEGTLKRETPTSTNPTSSSTGRTSVSIIAAEDVVVQPSSRTQRWIGSLAGIHRLTLGTDADVGTVEARLDGPITAAMNDICVECADVVANTWRMMRSMLIDGYPSVRQEIDALEVAIARMMLHESRARPTKHGHIVYLDRVFTGLAGETKEDVSAVVTLCLTEQAGVQFDALEEFQSFQNGLSRRIGPRRNDGTNEEMYDSRQENLFKRVAYHLPHIADPGERAALGTADVFLLGLDLFADAKGAIPLCKCLRVAVRSRWIKRDSAFYLLRLFGPDRTDDLIELLGTAELPAAALEILPHHPNETTRRDLQGLQSLLRGWVRAGKPSAFARFAAGFAA